MYSWIYHPWSRQGILFWCCSRKLLTYKGLAAGIRSQVTKEFLFLCPWSGGSSPNALEFTGSPQFGEWYFVVTVARVPRPVSSTVRIWMKISGIPKSSLLILLLMVSTQCLSWAPEASRSQSLTTWTFTVYREGLMGLCHSHQPEGLNNSSIPQGYLLKMVPWCHSFPHRIFWMMFSAYNY